MQDGCSTDDFIIELFCRIDQFMQEVKKHSAARLWPSEIVTLAILFVLKGRSERSFYRWANRDLRKFFPLLPERTRLFRLFVTHQNWSRRFLAQSTFFGVADSFGIELLATRRLGRSPRQIALKGMCAGKWIAGIKLGWIINCHGQICSWDAATANVYDADAFAPLIQAFDQQMIILADCNFHKSPYHRKNDPDPANLKICPRNSWNQRRLIETTLSMVNAVCCLKKLTERSWSYLKAHLGFVAAAFNLLLNWDGDTKLSIARFSL